MYANNIIIYLDSNGISYLVNSQDDLLPYSLKIFESENFRGFLYGLENLSCKWPLMNAVIIKSLQQLPQKVNCVSLNV